MGNVLANFFSAEAGQKRRKWLSGIDDRFSEGARNVLGPDLYPRMNALANLGAMMSPGADVQDAYQASSEMMAPNRSALDRAGSGAAMVGAVGAMLMPGGVSSIRQGIDDVVDAGVRAYDPNTVNVFAGPRAATADTAKLTRAQEMAESGASRDDIWNETGWFRGVDGKWRFEIDDSEAESAIRETAGEIAEGIIDPSTALTFGEVFDHKILFDAYPSIDNVPTRLVSGQRLDAVQPGTYGGVTRGGDLVFRNDIIDAGRPLHEVQHLIQRSEGFASGGDPRVVGSDNYFNLAGEVEARNVTNRTKFDADLRRANPPWTTQDVPDDAQIVSYGAGRQALVAQDRPALPPELSFLQDLYQ